MEILDNLPIPDEVTFKEKYIEHPKHKAYIVEFLKSIHSPLAGKVAKFKSGSVVTQWQDASNSTCCGIYCMRHLETYIGNGKMWRCGLTKGNAPEALRKLRIKYLYRILTSELNELRDDLLSRVNES